jgi:type III restriction enzyme
MPAAEQQQPLRTAAEVESPIINSPFREPQCHWQIERGVPPVKAEGRRRAGYFYRVPEHAGRGRKSKAQVELFEDEKGEEVDLALVNAIRDRVKSWRNGEHSGGLAYDGASGVTKELLELWRSEDRMQRLFFAQIEAIETILFLVEASEIYRKGLPEVPRDEPSPVLPARWRRVRAKRPSWG